MSLLPGSGLPHNHTAWLVRDIQRSAEELTELLGISWGPVMEFDTSESTVDGHTTRDAIKFAISVQGPPYLELLECTTESDGLWGSAHAEQFHHIGITQNDLDEALLSLGAAGLEPQGVLRKDGELCAIYLPRSAAHGGHIELVRPRP